MKKVLISGSSSGMGAALAHRLVQQGVTVVGLARDHAKLNLMHANYLPFVVDFSQMQRLETSLKQIRSTHSDIDAMISCCGYGHFAELEQFSFAAMQKMMNVNFLSQALLVKTFIADLKKRQNAKIIFIGSECSLSGQKKGSMYCASKFALRG